MGKKSLFPLILVFCVYFKIIQCDELAKCFSQPPESCPLQTPQNKCKCVTFGDMSLFCCHMNVQLYDDLMNNFKCSGATFSSITALHIYNMTTQTFYLEKMSSNFKKLMSFSITNSNITRIQGRLDHTQEITCLNMSNNAYGTEWLEPSALENLKKLARLDLSNVNITRLPTLKIQVPLFLLDVSNNNKMDCNSILDLLTENQNKNQIIFVNRNKTFCVSSIKFDWFNSTEKLDLDQVEVYIKITKDCPKYCSCKGHGYEMIWNSNSSTIYNVKVDCSFKQLSNLPENLPENTVQLNVTGNNITNIDKLTTDVSYKSLRYLYADENKISNILSLEGSPFMDNYIVLSLKLNQLKQIPIYILQNSFRFAHEGLHVYLGGNKLHCDCSIAQSFKVWLLSYRTNIPDFDEILCDNFHYKLKVVDLDQKLVCITQSDWTQYIYYIIAAELSLLLLLIGKVSYDYWVFKTAGYLPWPASKMPKLPCDWVFE